MNDSKPILTEKIKERVREYSDQIMIAGVSGGPDSMALLDLLYRSGIRVVAAHVNYHKRDSALRDEKIVEAYCKSRDIPYEKLDAVGYQEGNFQNWAREIRYGFYEKLAEKYGSSLIALGHHQDDLLETYLIQKQRGITPQYYGLAWQRDQGNLHILRPLLDMKKEDLIGYCHANQIEYGLDESNESPVYLRNRIRKELKGLKESERIRLLEEINEKNRISQKEQEEKKTLFKKHWIQDPKASGLLSDLLFEFTQKRYSKEAIQTYLQVLQNTRHLELGSFSLDLIPEKDRDILLKIEQKVRKERKIDSLQDLFEIQEGEPFQLEFSHQGSVVEKLSLSPSDFPLTLRSFRSGDSIQMRFGRKKLSRFFIDRKIPRYLREIWPVIENASGEIIFVNGLGAAKDHFDGGTPVYMRTDVKDFRDIVKRYDIMNFDLY